MPPWTRLDSVSRVTSFQRQEREAFAMNFIKYFTCFDIELESVKIAVFS